MIGANWAVTSVATSAPRRKRCLIHRNYMRSFAVTNVTNKNA